MGVRGTVSPPHRTQLSPGSVPSHLGIQGGDFLLVGGGGQEIAHLGFERIVHLHIDVVAGCLLLVIGVHTGGMGLGRPAEPHLAGERKDPQQYQCPKNPQI